MLLVDEKDEGENWATAFGNKDVTGVPTTEWDFNWFMPI